MKYLFSENPERKKLY